MISASHNPYRDNGIKIIDHSGFKLPDEDEHVLERDIFAFLESGVRAEPARLEIDEGLDSEYIEHLAATLPTGLFWNTITFAATGNIEVSATPEPGTAMLAMLAGSPLLIRRRQRA